jgi:hypothetical protein
MTERTGDAAQGADAMIGKIAETIFIVSLITGVIAMMYPRELRINFSMGTLWFLCGAAVCYVWL